MTVSGGEAKPVYGRVFQIFLLKTFFEDLECIVVTFPGFFAENLGRASHL